MNILPMWAVILYFVVLGAFLVLAELAAPNRTRRSIRHASRLWAPGGTTRIPPQRSLLAAPPPPATPVPAPPTVPLTMPDDTIPLAVTSPADMIRPAVRNIPIPVPAGVNGHIVICPLCGGGNTAGRILLPGRPDCLWCSPRPGGAS
jgi:hypothetical protein